MTADGDTVDLVVVGQGYVGLPLVQAAVGAGLRVTGLDKNQAIVDQLNTGHSHIDDVSDSALHDMIARGYRATTDVSVLATTRTIVICVPTPLSEDGGPDLRAVLAAASDVSEHLRPNTLVVLESTTYPGTTEDTVQPILEAGGLSAGTDFALAFSPERVDPGNAKYGITNTPKVVGGVTDGCTRAAAEFYGRFVDQIVTARGTREAEMAKLLENTYRHVNIALVNEMAIFCHELGIDLWDVIACASTKPFGFQAFRPGPGVGGHCIPIDPNYLSYTVKSLGYPFRFVELAEEINNRMPDYVVGRVADMLNDIGMAMSRSHVLLLGVTYKANIADQRESPARPVARKLLNKGAKLSYHDPFVDAWAVDGTPVPKRDDLAAAMAEADLIVLLTDHDEYQADLLGGSVTPLLDTRGVTYAAGRTAPAVKVL